MVSYAPTLGHVTEIVQRYEMNGDEEITTDDDYIDLYDFALMLRGFSSDSQIDQACDAVMAAVDNYIILNRNSDIKLSELGFAWKPWRFDFLPIHGE